MKTKLNVTAVAIMSVFLMTSCSENENQKTVKNLEKCLGAVKTIEDSNSISQEEAIEMAKCMLPHLQKVKDKVDKMKREEAQQFLQELETETEKSEYSEIIKELNYRKVKKLTSLGGEDDNHSEDWDKIIDDYEIYVDDYIDYFEKVNSGDMSALEDYSEVLEKAEMLDRKLKKAENSLSSKQVSRLTKIQNKMTKVLSEMN